MSAPAFFIDSGGSVRPVDPSEIEGASQLGWIPASPKQVGDWHVQQKYGSGGQQAIAGLEGLGRGLTLGLSTPIERGLGVPAADIAGREKANPLTAGVSEAAGVAAPLVSTLGGASAVSGPGLALRAGRTVTRALAPEAATVAGRILGGGAAAAAGSAVEGAFYGAGRVVHEAALGDPNLTAQSALATIGLSAGLLGGMSGAGKVLGTAIKEYTPKDLAAKVAELAERAEAHANFNATNAMPQKIKGVIRGKGSGATALGLEGRDLGILKNPFSDSADTIFERATEVRNTAGKELDSIASGASATGPQASWGQIEKDVLPIGKALRAQGATIPVAEAFEKKLQDYAQAYAGRDLDVAGLWGLRKDLGDFIYQNGKVLDPWVKELNTPIKRVYDHVDSLIERAIEEGSGKQTLKSWQAANRRFEVASAFSTLAESGIERSAANNPVHISGMAGAVAGAASHGVTGLGLGAALAEGARRRGASAIGWTARMVRDAMREGGEAVADKSAELIAEARQQGMDTLSHEASDAPQAVHVLSAFERMNQSVANQVKSAASTIVRAGPKAQNVSRGEVAAGIAHVFGKSPDEARSLYEKRVGDIQRLNHDPEQLHRALVSQTDDWFQHAPKTAEAMNTTSARGVAFLASKIPAPPQKGPLAPKWQASRDDVSRFNRYYEAVEHPLHVLKQAAAGTLTPEAMEALEVVHPALLNEIRHELVSRMASQKRVPYQGRLMLSLLMQQDMDGSLAQPALAHAAASFQRPIMPMPGKVAHGKSTKMTVSQRTMTPLQASANRGGG